MSRRADAVRRVRGWVIRGGLVGAWALVGWGTLLLLVIIVGALREGPGVAFGRLVPAPGASIWGWLNTLSVALALTAWLVALGLFLWSRRPPDDGHAEHQRHEEDEEDQGHD